MTDAAIGEMRGGGMLRRAAKGRTLPVLAVLLAIVAIWYAGAVGLNEIGRAHV